MPVVSLLWCHSIGTPGSPGPFSLLRALELQFNRLAGSVLRDGILLGKARKKLPSPSFFRAFLPSKNVLRKLAKSSRKARKRLAKGSQKARKRLAKGSSYCSRASPSNFARCGRAAAACCVRTGNSERLSHALVSNGRGPQRLHYSA